MMYPSIIPAPSKVALLGGMLIGKLDVVKETVPDMGKEAYEITIKDKITVKASTDAGFYYADITLEQLFQQYGDCIPCMIIEDEPRYAYRAFMIDCCRHFFKVADIKKMIDLCASFKFNKFHWHLSEDQGWRIEIEKYPQLTEIGSVRHGSYFGKEISDEDYGGYYTKADMKEIVDYAARHFIEVIPEIDIPGHSSGILAAMPELTCSGNKVEVKTTAGIFWDLLCAGNENSYKVIFDIIDELCDIFPGEYFHIGGDEVPKLQWTSCKKCQAKMKELGYDNEEQLQGYFVNRVSDYLRSRGKTVISWNESLKGGNLSSENVIQLWMDKDNLCKKSPNRIIISDFYHYYMDYPYEMTPLKKVYNYDDKVNGKVIGVETPIWCEYVSDIDRMIYMCFPRFIAVAQNGWSKRKPAYETFEKDLINIMKMYDTTEWAQRDVWNRPLLIRNVKTAFRFIGTLNREFADKLLDDRKKRKKLNEYYKNKK
ncbi:MAG: beta-N-acetylhexosaminidase [Acutalibacteraceae bacterium]|nr:beta-N-acetylhexosaminidase [Oscillospiraceae bacterium]